MNVFQVILTALIPIVSGFISAEWAKGWAYVQSLGGVKGTIVGAIAAALGAALFPWVAAHVPGVTQFIPADFHNLTADEVAGFLTGLLNLLYHTPAAQKAARLKAGKAF